MIAFIRYATPFYDDALLLRHFAFAFDYFAAADIDLRCLHTPLSRRYAVAADVAFD